ncbi:MAG: PQQ-binding-like beta-propeller repeat protein [Candidatus Brocadiia bacterium]
MRTNAAAIGVLALLAAAPVPAADAPAALDRMGVSRGICVVLGDRGGALARELAEAGELTLLVHAPDPEAAAAAAREADAAGLYGTRIVVARGEASRIGLAGDVADAVVVAAGGQGQVPRDEMLRVLRPGGKALLGDQTLVKPAPEGTDAWSHHYHGPDNNPQSLDRLARAPYLTQFVARPRYGPCPQMAVAAGGRLFMAFGHVAWHRREEPWLNTLVAVDGCNGTIRWTRPLEPGLMVDRSTMIATPQALYLADDQSCQLLDPATGQPRGEITVPVDLAGGTFWKWMALDGGVLYALVGRDEKQDPVARWRRTAHGWPWGGISEGYNKGPYPWGFASNLFALHPGSGEVLWHHREREPIDSRALAMADGRLYACSFGRTIVCIDAKTGRTLWRRTAEDDPEVFQAIGPYRPGHGYVGGWKSTVYLKATAQALYIVGPQVHWLTALSAEDGRVLWTYKKKDLHVVVRPDALWAIGCQKSERDTARIHPLTGEVLATYPVHRRACTRSTGTADGILFRAHGGSTRLDVATGRPQFISPMRPSCHVGVVVAHGHLYWLPWVCDCNLQMFGLIGLGPAGRFEFGREATEADRLEQAEGVERVAAFPIGPRDWPAYRADNARSARTAATVPARAGLRWEFGGRTEPTAPVAAGGRVFLGAADGTVRALDAASGKTRWTAYTGGAVRYPPALAEGRALVGSGDGYAYAFEAASGRLLWRFRAAPAERRVPVYGRLLSTWPVASGVLVAEGTAYFAAGIHDFDGTHVYALDAATGRLRWQNNAAGHLDAFSRRGVACQGEMLLHEGRLYLAGGNAVSPAAFDAATGRCLSPPPKGNGTRAPRGRELALQASRVVARGQPLYSRFPVYDKSCQWPQATVEAANASLTLAEEGDRGRLVARERGGKVLWRHDLPAPPVRYGIAVTADGQAVVALRDGRVLCFGSPEE